MKKRRFFLILVSLIVLGTGLQIRAETTQTKNLLPYTFQDENKDGFPDGYKKNKNLAGKLFYDNEIFFGKSGTSIKIDLPEEGNAFLDLAKYMYLKKNKKYFFTVQIKVKDLRYKGNWYENGLKHCIAFYIYGINNKHTWQVISGSGSTNGWITLIMPFDPSKVPELATSRIFIRCLNISGTVWLQNPTIIEMPESITLEASVILQDGRTVAGGNYIIK